jgi:hypothetical protein
MDSATIHPATMDFTIIDSAKKVSITMDLATIDSAQTNTGQ